MKVKTAAIALKRLLSLRALKERPLSGAASKYAL